MTDLEEIAVNRREDGEDPAPEDPVHPAGEDPSRQTGKNVNSRGHKNSSDVEGSRGREINTTRIASVFLGFTLFVILLYLFTVVAVAVSLSCPYQTPGANLLRCILDILDPDITDAPPR